MKINKRFQSYIDSRINWFRVYQKKNAMSFPLSAEDVKEVAEYLSGDLSPENLMCDGEISRAQGQAKYRKLMNVSKDLSAYAKKMGYPEPNIYY